MLAAHHHPAPAHGGGHHHEHRPMDGAAPAAQSAEAAKAKAADVTPPDVIENKGAGGGRGRSFKRGRLLGKGGFAKCWEYVCLTNGHVLACKVVPKNTLEKERAAQKLVTEVAVHASLLHKHVVKFHSYFEDAANVYLMLEKCDNGSLIEMLRRRKQLSESEVAFFLLQLIDALRYLHANRIIHRDLKLGNLFLSADNTLKIGDFGLACLRQTPEERRRTMCGTPNYIAPEILIGEAEYGHEVDIWSVGCIMYTLLVGAPPFETKSVKETYKRIKSGVYAFPEGSPVSDHARELIRAMLAPCPAKRPSLAAVLDSAFFRHLSVPRSLPDAALHSTVRWRPEALVSGTAAARAVATADVAVAAAPLPVTLHLKKPRAPLMPVDNNARAHAPAPLAAPPAVARGGAAASDAGENECRPDSAPAHARLASPLRGGGAGARRDAPPVPAKPSTAHAASGGGGAVQARQPVGAPRPAAPAPVAAPRSAWDAKPAAPHGGGTGSAPAPATAAPRRGGGGGVSTPASGATSARSPDSGGTGAGGGGGGGTGREADMDGLRAMHAQLLSSFGGSEAAGRVRGEDAPHMGSVPPLWVTTYVDYTNKYGMGYMFSDGSVGIYFNDASKIVLASDKSHFEYIERTSSKARGGARAEPPRARHTVADYPVELKKKVTLLEHFRSHLEQHYDAECAPTASAEEAAAMARGGPCRDLVFVKKWVGTKHAVLFRLSNKSVQVCDSGEGEAVRHDLTPAARQVKFKDGTSVTLGAGAKMIAYIDKAGRRSLHAMDADISPARPDIAKRLRYTRDILSNILAAENAPRAEDGAPTHDA